MDGHVEQMRLNIAVLNMVLERTVLDGSTILDLN